MDKYKKKIIICFALACMFAYVGGILLFDLSWIKVVASALVIILCLWCFLALNKRMRNYLNPNVYPSNEWYRDHLERNFDYLIVGDRNSCTNNEVDEKLKKNNTIFDIRLADENLYSTFKVLQATFSIVKDGGTILVPVSSKDLTSSVCNYEDERRYWFVLRPYCFTMNKHMQMWIKICIRIPAFMFRVRDVLNICRKQPKFSKKGIANDESVVALLREMKDFCDQRNLVLQLVVHEDGKVEHWKSLANNCGL